MPRLIWVFAGCTCHLVGFSSLVQITRKQWRKLIWSGPFHVVICRSKVTGYVSTNVTCKQALNSPYEKNTKTNNKKKKQTKKNKKKTTTKKQKQNKTKQNNLITKIINPSSATKNRVMTFPLFSLTFCISVNVYERLQISMIKLQNEMYRNKAAKTEEKKKKIYTNTLETAFHWLLHATMLWLYS